MEWCESTLESEKKLVGRGSNDGTALPALGLSYRISCNLHSEHDAGEGLSSNHEKTNMLVWRYLFEPDATGSDSSQCSGHGVAALVGIDLALVDTVELRTGTGQGSG